MGMVINDAVINLYAMQDYYNHFMMGSYAGFDRKDNESVKVAIDTMRKYQKIEQIYSDFVKYMNAENLADRIGEIIEDGKEKI